MFRVHRSSTWTFLVVLFTAGVCSADAIIVDGRLYPDVRIFDGPTRYYVQVPAEDITFSVRKHDVDPENVYVGDEEPPAHLREQPTTINAGARTVVLSEEADQCGPLEINALVLKNPDLAMAFCAIDTAAIGPQLVDAVCQLLAEGNSIIGPDNLMISATHTQAGAFRGVIPGALQEVAFGDFSQERLDRAATKIAEAIRAAETALEPARLSLAKTSAGQYNFNRSYEDGAVDPTMTALEIRSSTGVPTAYLVNFAAHPTLVAKEGEKTDAVSRDFPGGLALQLRKACDSDVPVLFINGAVGNVGPKPPGGLGPASEAYEMGIALASRALEGLEEAQPRGDAEFRCRTREVELPGSLLDAFIAKSVTLQDFWIGDAVFLSLPGEPCSQIGLALRTKAREQGAKYVFLCGLTGDYVGYQTDVREYFGAEFEAMMTFFGPLMVRWYLENHLPAEEQLEPWNCSPMLKENKDAYLAGKEKGETYKEAIQERWNTLITKLTPLAPVLISQAGDQLPPEAKRLLKKVPPTEAAPLALQFAGVFARSQYKGIMTDADRATLVGIANGAGMPFDGAMLLQFIAKPLGVPEEATQILLAMGIVGIDFMGQTGEEPPPVPGQPAAPPTAETDAASEQDTPEAPDEANDTEKPAEVSP